MVSIVNRTQLVTVGLYFVLLAICGGLLLVSDFLSFKVRDAIIPVATDGFKLVLGATVGAISAILGVKAKSTD